MENSDNHSKGGFWSKIKKALANIAKSMSGENAPNWHVVIATWCIVFITLGIGVWQICSFKAASHADLRAYFSVRVVQWNVHVGQQLVTVVEFKNVGKTPAYDVSTNMVFKLGTGVYQSEFDLALKEQPTLSQVISPGQGFNNVTKWRVYTEVDSVRVASGKAVLARLGQFTYRDQFGERHFIHCCYVYNSVDNNWALYDRFNDAD
jgi:hypothetical protein